MLWYHKKTDDVVGPFHQVHDSRQLRIFMTDLSYVAKAYSFVTS